MIKNIENEILNLKNTERSEDCSRFFKTGKGEYGEGDKFLGISNPVIRKLARKYYKEMTIEDVLFFLKNEYHEIRLFGLIVWTYKFPKETEDGRKQIYELYISNTEYINNWDLVDLSAYKIVGEYLSDKKKEKLYEFANSDDLWKQRISIIATFTFIRNNEFEDTLNISEILLNHSHDLIHKAVGWMLREVGKRDLKIEEEFLQKYYKDMPRTMLRYAIEKFDEDKRQRYLKGKI